MAEDKKPVLTDEQRQMILKEAGNAADAGITAKRKQDVADAARVATIANHARDELLKSGVLAPETKTAIEKTAQEYDAKLLGSVIAAEVIFKNVFKFNDDQLKNIIGDSVNAGQKEIKAKLEKGNLEASDPLRGEVMAMKKSLIEGGVLEPAELKQAGIAAVKAEKTEGITKQLKKLFLEQAINDYVAKGVNAEYAQNPFGSESRTLSADPDAIVAKLSPNRDYYENLRTLTNDLQKAIVDQGKEGHIVHNVIKTIKEQAKKEVEIAANPESDNPLKARIAEVKAEIKNGTVSGQRVVQDAKATSNVTAQQPPESILAPENPKSYEDDYTRDLKRALLRGEISRRVEERVGEKYPELRNSQNDTEVVHGILGRDQHAMVFAAIGRNLTGGIGGNHDPDTKVRKLSQEEDFAMGSADYMLAIREQIDQGMHDKEIKALMGKVDDKFSSKYQSKLIDKARNELKDVATGSVSNDDNLKNHLSRLKEYHGLGVEVLEPSYKPGDNKTPEAMQKIVERMNKIISTSAKGGAALFKAHEAIKGIRSGEIDAETGLKTVRDQLTDAKLPYGRLDGSFDPNFARPEFPRKTDKEIRADIKQAVSQGNAMREYLIENGEQYNKPNYKLDVDKLLEGDPAKGKKVSGNTVNDKFAAITKDIEVSKLVAYNPPATNRSVDFVNPRGTPQGGQGLALV